MLVEVTKRNSGNFKGIAPGRELLRLENDENCFGLGYTDDAESLPDGVLIFTLDTELDDNGGMHHIAVITYFYIRESARDMYVGTYLFSELLEMAQNCYIEAIRCDVPMGYEYNLLCNALESFGFEFSLMEVFEFERPLKDYLQLPAFKKRPAIEALLLCDIPQKLFSSGLRNIVKNEDLSDYDISYNMDDYDKELSTVILKNKIPTGFFLVKKDTDGCIVPELLRAEERSSKIYLSLIYESIQVAMDKCGKMAPVKVRLHNNAGIKLLENLFPDFAPYIVRRGYFVV